MRFYYKMSQVGFKKNIVIATIAIIAVGLAIAPTIFSNLAQAQSIPNKRSAQGEGFGDVNCPGDDPPGTESIHFNSGNRKMGQGGSWLIQNMLGQYKFGTITDGKVIQESVTLHGNEQVDRFCFGQVPASITITTTCGIGVPISFSASNGETAQFTGNVACEGKSK